MSREICPIMINGKDFNEKAYRWKRNERQ